MGATLPVQLPRAGAAVVRPLRDDVVIAVLGGIAAGGWAVGWLWPSFWSDRVMAGVSVLVTAAFVAAAAFVAREPSRRRAGILLFTAGLLWPLNSSVGWVVGPLPFIRSLMEGVFWVVLAFSLFLYQHPKLAWPERLLLGYAIFHFVVLDLVWSFFSVPEWVGYPASAWWPTLFVDRPIFNIINKVLITGALPVAVAFAVLIIRRQRWTSGLDRYSMAPIVAAIVVAAVAAGVSWATYGKTVLPDAVVLLTLPVAFLASALRRRLFQAHVSDLLAELAGAPRLAAVTDSLRTALRDPSLMVLYWVPERQCYVDEHSRKFDHQGEDPGRMTVPVLTSDGRALAVVSTTATSSSSRVLVEAAVRANGLAIENASLQAVVQAQLESIRQAHSRVVQAGLDERRRLERNLHDGAQQRLLAAMSTIGLVAEQLAGHEVVATLSRASDDLHQALGELRELAQGLHPTILTSEGLAAAIQGVIERLGTPVRMDITATRLPSTVEATAYFVICEALANIVKHSESVHASVTASVENARLRLEICDDGLGNADPNGRGISGMADRIRTLGGEFTLHSDPGSGTLVRAWMPCA